MKVFISWSGDRSNKIAEIMKKWIKHVIQSVEPFVSSQDLPTGTRWSNDIAKELQDTNFGILCVTKTISKNLGYYSKLEPYQKLLTKHMLCLYCLI